jgi:hypothetical protein
MTFPSCLAPTMMVTCMNDAGPIADPNNTGRTIPDPLYQSGDSQFCNELPFMPGQTGYFDTPVVPTSAFAGDCNTPDCAYPGAHLQSAKQTAMASDPGWAA